MRAVVKSLLACATTASRTPSTLALSSTKEALAAATPSTLAERLHKPSVVRAKSASCAAHTSAPNFKSVLFTLTLNITATAPQNNLQKIGALSTRLDQDDSDDKSEEERSDDSSEGEDKEDGLNEEGGSDEDINRKTDDDLFKIGDVHERKIQEMRSGFQPRSRHAPVKPQVKSTQGQLVLKNESIVKSETEASKERQSKGYEECIVQIHSRVTLVTEPKYRKTKT
ncbi:hypothetical protein FRC07_009589 [Ceratobasidium sp. 392]|nr:hypothetical protein FRC07_009589 [Ceratobasidium sp. 392]